LIALLLPLAFAFSPSEFASFCMAVGEIPRGKENFCP
jgi:hypothetical protein